LTRAFAGANIRTMPNNKPAATCEPLLPRHLRWKKFLERLAGPDACNFQTDSWTCFGDLRFSTRILREMGLDKQSIDVTTAYFKNHSGYCDCEVIFNVDHPR